MPPRVASGFLGLAPTTLSFLWWRVIEPLIAFLDQSGRTGLGHSHSTTRFAVVAAAVDGAPAPVAVEEVAGDRSGSLDGTHLSRREAAKKPNVCLYRILAQALLGGHS